MPPEVPRGPLLVVVCGPNGAGKSTLLAATPPAWLGNLQLESRLTPTTQRP